MTSDLFPDCRQDSPRLAWMKRHHINVIELESVLEIEEDEFGNEYGRYNVTLDYESEQTVRGYGMMLDEALADFASKLGIPLWNEEQYAKERGTTS